MHFAAYSPNDTIGGGIADNGEYEQGQAGWSIGAAGANMTR